MEESGQIYATVASLPGKEPTVSIAQEAGWAPEPVCTRWRGEKNTCPFRESNSARPACSLVTLLTELNFTMYDRMNNKCYLFNLNSATRLERFERFREEAMSK